MRLKGTRSRVFIVVTKRAFKQKQMDILTEAQYDRIQQLKAFDDTKAGVKGIVDAAAGRPINIPKIFIRPPDELAEDSEHPRSTLHVPAIDLNGVDEKGSLRREKIMDELRTASETWGFFRVVNHGIPMKVLKDMLHGVREFHELDADVKKEYYSREQDRMVKFNSNYDLYKSRAANWRDTLSIYMLKSYHLDPQDLPSVCRDSTVEYIKYITKLGDTMFELLSEALGLETNYLKRLECAKGRTFVCHYYPACPMPDQTLGIGKHTDAAFLTVLVQDEIGGLQVLHDNQWADVEPIPGSLIINVGDLLQIISNDKFKSVIHRAFADRTRPRTSVACFFAGVYAPPKIYGPIMELITEESPPVFKEFTVRDYVTKFYSRPLDEKSGLNHVRIYN